MSELRRKTISGLIWTFGQQFGFQIINFIVSIILARLLLPEEFGLIGMIAVFITLGKSLVNSGMSSSLIRTEKPDHIDYSTVFYANLLISVIVYVSIVSFSPFISAFFNQPILSSLLKFYCLTFIISAFSTVQSTKLNKEMNFKTQLLINIPSLIAGSILGIYLAYAGYGVWSLIWMHLFQTTMATIQLWIYSKWVPTFIFNYERLKLHLSFGYKLTLTGILNSVINNIYNIIIGKLFPPAQLGFFIRAKSMQELPVANITSALNKVTYPMFASIINEDERLKSIYRRLIQQVFFWIVPILIISIIVAEPLFRILLTDKWLPSVPYFQILCIAGIVMPLNTYNLNILLVKGKSGQYFKLESYKNGFIIAGTLLVIPFGIYGLLWGLIVATYISYFINAFYCGKNISLSLFEQFKDIFPTLIIGLLIGLIGFFIEEPVYAYLNSDLVFLILMSSGLFIVYFLTSYYFKLPAIVEIKSLLKNKLNGY